MAIDPAALVQVAHDIADHHDHVWGRLPFLGPMAVRVDRERTAGRLKPLIVELGDLLFDHLEREDRVLLAIASDDRSADVARRAARLHAEHALVSDLLDRIRSAVGGDYLPPDDAGRTERVLRAELADLDGHLREQIVLEEAVIAGGHHPR